jgi:hypothetical protein
MTEAAHIGLTDAPTVVDASIRRSAIDRARAQKIVLPTFAQLSWRAPIPQHIAARLRTLTPMRRIRTIFGASTGATRLIGATRFLSRTISSCRRR